MANASSSLPQTRVIFCSFCGTIMDEPTHTDTIIDCRACSATMPSSGTAAALAQLPCTAASAERALTRWRAACCSAVFEKMVLYSTGVEHQVEADPADGGGQEQQQRARATVNEACPKCNHPELQYYTMQCVTLARTLLVLQRRPRGKAAQVSWRADPPPPPSARHSHAVCIACRPGCDQRMRGRPSSTSAPSAATPSRRTTEDMHTATVTVGVPIGIY